MFYSLPGIILDGIHKYFKLVFPVYGFRLTIFRPFGEHSRMRDVVDNFKVTSYNVASRIIYEWVKSVRSQIQIRILKNSVGL
jgi:hypothetical protein